MGLVVLEVFECGLGEGPKGVKRLHTWVPATAGPETLSAAAAIATAVLSLLLVQV